MGIYRGAGGTGDAVNDASSEAVLVSELVTEAQDSAAAAATSETNAAASASAASASASTASTAATNAETAETNAETAETNAETAQAAAEAAQLAAETAQTAAELAETNAETAETNAETAQAAAEAAQLAAETAQTAAELAETNAETAETNAETAETNAAASASAASGSASAAATSATNASNSASAASTSATNASNSASAAATSATNAAASYDEFDDRYLGSKSSNPTVDNDGNALITGALYFNTAVPEIRVWTGSVWNPLSAGGSVVSSFNTRNGDVTLTSSDVTTALTYTPLAPAAIGTTVQAYDAQLADIAGLTPTDNSFIVGNGTNFVSEDASTARTSLGLGTAATTASTDYATAAQGTTADSALQPAAIGVSVQGYDADTAKYDDTTANFTGTLQNGGSNVVVDSDIGSTVQGYDADLATIAGLTPTNQYAIIGNGTNWTSSALPTPASTLDDLTDVVITSPATDQVLKYNGTNWVNGTGSGGVTSITAGTGLSGGTITTSGTIAIDSTVATLTDTQTLTNKTLASPVYTGVLTGSAGTATDPSITTTGDTNTGIFFPAADTIAFSEGGTEAMRIDATGTVGISVVPSAWGGSFPALQVEGTALFGINGTSTFAGLSANVYIEGSGFTTTSKYINTATASAYIQNAGDHIWYTAPSGTAGNTITYSERLRIGNTGLITLGSGVGLSIARTAVTSPAAGDGNVFSGTYTPTLTNVTNVAASTTGACQYMRVGDVVTVSGQLSIDPTAIGNITVRMTLPIASDFSGSSRFCGGTFVALSGTIGEAGAILAFANATGQAEFRGDAASAANQSSAFSFTYKVI